MHKPHAESSADSWFCYLLKTSQVRILAGWVEKSPKSLWRPPVADPSFPLADFASNPQIFEHNPVSANVSTLNQMLANILNPKPDGFPLLISLNSICAILLEKVDMKSNL